jgi:hypothetical protein
MKKGGGGGAFGSSTSYLSSSTVGGGVAAEDSELEAAEATKRDLEDGDEGPLRKRDRK